MDTPRTYKSKPVEIEAMEFTGENLAEVMTWVAARDADLQLVVKPTGLVIPTLEGDMLASVGDFIIRGLRNEFYPCKPDVFAAKYEEVLIG